jgi:ubiquinone biosynthesis protein COQ4
VIAAVTAGLRGARDKVRAARAFLGLVKDPTQLELVFELADAAMDDATLDAMHANIRRHAQGAAALAARPRLEVPPLAELLALPAATLGHVYAVHLRDAGLDPAGLPRRPAADERAFILPHIYETHDVWHVVTGFGTDVAGELGLMAFYAAQAPSKGPIAILAAGLINTLRGGMADKDRRLDAIARGWLLGKRARPLFGAPWSLLWAMPLAEVRRRFAVDPAGVDLIVEEHRVVEEHPRQQQPAPHLPLPPP